MPYTIFSNFYKTKTALAKSLYPELLRLADDDYYRSPVYYTTYRLIADSVLSKEDLASEKKDLIQEAFSELKKLKADSSANHDKYSEDLENLVRILNYFEDDEIKELNKKIIAGNLYYHYSESLEYLAIHNQEPDQRLLMQCLEKPDYRFSVYHALDKGHKRDWYPSKYMKQQYFAESDLYNSLYEDGAPDEMKFITTLPVTYKNEKKLMYIFKAYYKDTEQNINVPYIAWAGPYSPGLKVIDVEGGELTGCDFKKWDDKIYKEHVSAQVREENNGDE